MRSFNWESTGLRTRYVFYEDLKNTHEALYQTMSSRLNSITIPEARTNRIIGIISNIKAMASVERSKELACIKQVLGVDISPQDLQRKDLDKQIMECINTIMQSKEAYKRALNRINYITKDGCESGFAQIGMASYFVTYLRDAFAEQMNKTLNSLSAIISANPNLTLEQCIEKLVDNNFIDITINQALEKMAASGDTKKNDVNKGLQEALNELIKSDAQMASGEGAKNFLVRRIRELYGLDRIIDAIKQNLQQQIQQNKNSKITKKQLKSNARNLVKITSSNKGVLAEVMSAAVLAAWGNRSGGSDSIKNNVQVEQTGNYGGKPDIVATINLDINPILNLFNKDTTAAARQSESVRKQNIEAMRKVTEKLEEIDSGFLIMTNAKEWALVRNKMANGYMFSGFSVEKKHKLDFLTNNLGVSDDVITAIVNTLDGAIGDKSLLDSVSDLLAEQIAYFLFDDFEVVGKTQTGAQTLHLMLLDGVYVPMSVCYEMLADAFMQADQESVVQISIDSSESGIEFPPAQYAGKWEPGMWDKQRDTAYNSFTVSVKFMKNFIQLMKQFQG